MEHVDLNVAEHLLVTGFLPLTSGATEARLVPERLMLPLTRPPMFERHAASTSLGLLERSMDVLAAFTPATEVTPQRPWSDLSAPLPETTTAPLMTPPSLRPVRSCRRLLATISTELP